MQNTSMDKMYICLQDPAFNSLGYIPKSRIAISYGNSTNILWRNCHILFHRGHTIFFNFYFILLYNTVFVLPYINMNLPRVYTSSQSQIPLPPPTTYHLSGSSPCTSPKHPASCIEHRFVFYMIVYMFQCHSPTSSHPLPLPQSPKVRSTHLCLFCCLAYRIIITIFLNFIYMC